MDIDLLSKMVKELILDRDRVVLPGLGTFVAEMVPATFSDRGYTINPPYRRLYFRSRQEDDSALVELYSVSNNIGKDIAGRILADFLGELKEVLKEKKTVVFPGLGRLRATRENNFFFVPDEDLDIYPEGFGLGPVSLKTHIETREELSAAVSQLKSMVGGDAVELGTMSEAEEVKMDDAESDEEGAAETEETNTEENKAEEQAAVEATEEAEKEKEAETETGEQQPVPRLSRPVRIMVTVIVVLIVLLLAYVALNHLSPGIFDNILYDSEQRKILERYCFEISSKL